MQVTLLDETWEYAKDLAEVEELFVEINEKIRNSAFYFSHLIVDGVEVFAEPYEYISEHIDSINELTVVVKTMKEIADQSFLSLESYLARALPEIPRLADEFYRGATSETWDRFNQLLEGVQWIVQLLGIIEKNQSIYHNAVVYLELSLTLQGELVNLEEGIRHQDMTLVGDIIRYEIHPLLQSIAKEVTRTIDHDIDRDSVN